MAVLTVGLAGDESSGEEASCSDDQWEVLPDDSASICGVAPRRCKAKLNESDLARLRSLVQRDDRFARVLDDSCRAVHEAVVAGNTGPVLALLASFMWRCLCISWEVDSGVSKARLQSNIMRMGDELRALKSDFQSARRLYFKELVGLRDQVRKIDKNWLVEVSHAVYQQDPVMYYEPLKHLDAEVRGHVAEVVEEKLKLVLSRLRGDEGKPQLQDAGTSPRAEDLSDKVAAEEAKVALRAAKQEAMKARAEARDAAAKCKEAEAECKEAEVALDAARRDRASLDDALRDRCSVDARAASENEALRSHIRDLENELQSCQVVVGESWVQFGQLAEQLEKCVPQVQLPSELGQHGSERLASTASAAPERLSQGAHLGEIPHQAVALLGSSDGSHSGSTPPIDSETRRVRGFCDGPRSIEGDYARPAAAARRFCQGTLTLVKDLLKVHSEQPDPAVIARNAVEKAELTALAEKDAREAEAAAAATAAATTAATAKAEAMRAQAEADLEAKRANRFQCDLEQAVEELRVARIAADVAEAAQAAAERVAEVERAAAMEAIVAAQAAFAGCAQDKGSNARALENLRDENRSLKTEIQQLQAMLDRLSKQEPKDEADFVGRMPPSAPRDAALTWRTPGGNVFVRLFQDALDRVERRRNLQERVQRARAEEILDVLKAELLESLRREHEGGGFELAPVEAALLLKLLSIHTMPVHSRSSPERHEADIEAASPEHNEGQTIVVSETHGGIADVLIFSPGRVTREDLIVSAASRRRSSRAHSPVEKSHGQLSRPSSRCSSRSPSPCRDRGFLEFSSSSRLAVTSGLIDDGLQAGQAGLEHLGLVGSALFCGAPCAALDALRGAVSKEVASVPGLADILSNSLRQRPASAAVGSATAVARAARLQGRLQRPASALLASLKQGVEIVHSNGAPKECITQFPSAERPRAHREPRLQALSGTREASLLRQAQRLLESAPGAAAEYACTSSKREKRPASAGASRLGRHVGRIPSAPTLH